MLSVDAQEIVAQQCKPCEKMSKVNTYSDESNKKQSCGGKIPTVVPEKRENADIMHPEKLEKIKKECMFFL